MALRQNSLKRLEIRRVSLSSIGGFQPPLFSNAKRSEGDNPRPERADRK